MSERRAGRSVFCVDRAVHNSPPPLDDVGGIDWETFDEKDPDRLRLYTPEVQAGVDRAKMAAAGHSTGKRERWVDRWGPEHDAALVAAPIDPCDPKVTGPEVYQYDTWAKRARDMSINGTTEGDHKEPPEHYATPVQPIALIDAGEAAGMIGYYEGQIIKYVFRWRKKNGLRDLKAAAWFLNRMIAREEARNPTAAASTKPPGQC